jgi:predicted small metal-binding protein
MKRLTCADLVPGCSFVIDGETMDEIVYRAVVHAVTAHGIEPTQELVAQVKAAARHRRAVALNG